MSVKTILYLGLRPFLPKKHGIKGVISHTIIVVAIAMLPLVVVLMVADGMIQGITNRYIETSSYHFRVYSPQPADYIDFDEYEMVKNKLMSINSIESVSLERNGAGVGVYGDSKHGIFIRGLEPDILKTDIGLSEYLIIEDGDFDLKGQESIVISGFLARKMNIQIGDDFRIVTGKILQSGKILPRVSKFEVKGIVKTGYEELDKMWVFVTSDLSKKIIPNNSSENYLGIKCDDPYKNLDSLYFEIKNILPSGWKIRRWTELNRYTYENFKTTKMVLALIMGLIVIVAAINISSSLIMLVLEKRRDISILKGMGLSPSEVMGSYLLTGVIIGIIGTIIGDIFGILISLNINQFIIIFEKIIKIFFKGINLIFNLDSSKSFILLNSEYYLENIPVELNLQKLLIMTFFSITTTAIASYLPARNAGLIKPLKVMQKY